MRSRFDIETSDGRKHRIDYRYNPYFSRLTVKVDDDVHYLGHIWFNFRPRIVRFKIDSDTFEVECSTWRLGQGSLKINGQMVRRRILRARHFAIEFLAAGVLLFYLICASSFIALKLIGGTVAQAGAFAHPLILSMLLSLGFDPNAVDRIDAPPLHMAAGEARTESIKVLLKHGVEVDLQEASDGWTALHYAAREDSLETIQFLIESGANTELTCIHGDTPLVIAMRFGNYAATEALLEAGVNVSPFNKKGKTPLHQAAAYGSPVEMCRLVLDHGADINALTESKFPTTPISLAIENKNNKVLSLFIDRGAVIDKQLPGETAPPIHAACMFDNIEALELLVKSGADVNMPSNKVAAPLHAAAINGSLDCIKFLVEAGAIIKMPFNMERVSPLHLAADKGNLDAVRMLVALGSDPQAVSPKGETPADFAKESGHQAVFEYLSDLQE